MMNFGRNLFLSEIIPSPHQLVALAKLIVSDSNGILICDGVGVGKTISAGYILNYYLASTRIPGLVICPPMLVKKWESELRNKFALSTLKITSREELSTALDELKYQNLRIPPVYVMSNSLLYKNDLLSDIPKCILVVDEIHNFRNNMTKSHKNLKSICKNAKVRVGLTATPINNSIEDLVSELALCLADYSHDVVRQTLMDIWNSNDIEFLFPFITRFDKTKLKTSFVKRNVKTLTADYNFEYFNRAEDLIKVHCSRRGITNHLALTTYYRMASSSPAAFFESMGLKKEVIPEEDPKLNLLKEITNEFNNSKFIVFCEFIETVEYLKTNLESVRDVLIITGETFVDDRKMIIDRFKSSNNSILILSSVGSEGIDLQFCNRLVNYDLHWNPMVLEQRIGRVDRMGQAKSEVFIYNILVRNSIDERVLHVINEKLHEIAGTVFTSDAIIDSKIDGFESENNRGHNYLKELEDIEKEKALKMIESIERSSHLNLDDYQMLNFVDLKYCDPALAKDSKMDKLELWIRGGHNNEWVIRTQKRADNVKKTLNGYQRLISEDV